TGVAAARSHPADAQHQTCNAERCRSAGGRVERPRPTTVTITLCPTLREWRRVGLSLTPAPPNQKSPPSAPCLEGFGRSVGWCTGYFNGTPHSPEAQFRFPNLQEDAQSRSGTPVN